MKGRMTIAAVFLAAVMIAAALIPAATGATGLGTGTADDPRYIIGTSSAEVEIAGGVNAQIEFNRTAFSAGATVKLYVAKKVANQTWGEALTFAAQESGPKVATATPIGGASVTITETDAANGIYDMRVESTKAFDATTILVKVKIIETFNGNTAEQEFVWAANVCSQYSSGGKIVIDGVTDGRTSFAYETSYALGISVKDGDDTLEGYEFFATGLPAGLSITSDKKIGGKLAVDPAQSGGSFTVYAVLGGEVLSEEVSYTIGDRTVSNFTYTTDRTDTVEDPGYAIIKTGDKITVTAVMDEKYIADATYISAVVWNGTSSESLTVSADGTDTDGKTMKFTMNSSDLGLGTYKVDMTYHYATNGQEKTVTKSIQIFIVGNIYHADLDPTVTTNP